MQSDNIEGIFKLTEARLKKLDMNDLVEIMKYLIENEPKSFLQAIQDSDWYLCGRLVKLAACRISQEKYGLDIFKVPEMLKKQVD